MPPSSGGRDEGRWRLGAQTTRGPASRASRGADVEVRLARLEEGVQSLKASFTLTQRAGGLFLGLILLLVGSLLSRTFTLGDQISELMTAAAETRVGVANVQRDLDSLKLDLTGISGELRTIRAELAALRDDLGGRAAPLSRPESPTLPREGQR